MACTAMRQASNVLIYSVSRPPLFIFINKHRYFDLLMSHYMDPLSGQPSRIKLATIHQTTGSLMSTNIRNPDPNRTQMPYSHGFYNWTRFKHSLDVKNFRQ